LAASQTGKRTCGKLSILLDFLILQPNAAFVNQKSMERAIRIDRSPFVCYNTNAFICPNIMTE